MSAYATDAAATSYAAYPGTRLSSHQAQGPDGKTLVEGYRKDIIAGFEKDPPRFNPMNPERTQSSALVDLRDPIQVHLLTEIALVDSKEYEILSQEEVDDLKKQIQSLGQRIDSTRNNLLIQSKYRDAAISMARLYSPGRPEGGRRRSILGRNSGGGGDVVKAKEAEVERQASERKCEELASELFNLEKRFMEPQRRLLEHTAGILQLTHKVSKRKNNAPSHGQPVNGMPGSPESLYTYARNSMDQAAEGNYFDESPYEFDQLDGLQTSQPRAAHIEIPLKSPIREQNNQLREDLDRAKEENEQLRRQTDTLVQSISEMEARFENLNGSLRDAIVQFNPTKNDDFIEPPFASQKMEPGQMLKNQMDYLETGIFAIQAEQEDYSGGEKMSQRIESLNQHIREILLTVDPDHPPAPHPSQTDVDGQISYLEDSMRAVDSELERALRTPKMESIGGKDSDQIETVLVGLWEIIQSGFANIKQQKEERRRARLDKGLEDDEGSDDEVDTDEPYTLHGFSARVQWLYRQATTLKDQKAVLKRQIKQQRELNNKSDAEKDEEIARKQEEIEENRLLVSRAERDAMDAQEMLSEALEDLQKARDAANNTYAAQAVADSRDKDIEERDAHIKKRDIELQERDAQLEEHKTLLQQHKAQIEEHQAQLEDHASLSEHHAAQMQERNAKIATLESDLQELQAHIHSAESSSKTSQSKLNEVETTIATLTEQLAVATQSQATSEESAHNLKKQYEEQKEDLDEKTKLLKVKEDELEMLSMNLAEIKTELTIAQAELEGAYGSRAERAADLAAMKTGAETTKLQNQITKLKSELSGTVQELEDVTKESLGAEREKIELENKLDDAEQLKNSLEGELAGLRDRLEEEMTKARERMAQLQDELDGERLKAVPGQGGPGRAGTGASIISERFRTTMREERKKFQEELKEERSRTRKIEEELSRLKRGQAPSKGSSSPR